MPINFISKEKLNNFKNKTCFLRIDLNLDPLKDNELLRLKSVIPTIKLLLEIDAKIIIASHKGRPSTTTDNEMPTNKEYSLKPFMGLLSEKLNNNVVFLEDFNTQNNKKTISNSKEKIFLLENLRFHEGEKNNKNDFAKSLASLADFYVNDAFAVCHRKNASIVAITNYLPSFGGLHLKKEIDNLGKVMEKYEPPLTIIIGGIKTGNKIGVMDNFWEKADNFIIGGGAANTFLKAKGEDIKSSIFDESSVNIIKKYLNAKKITLPIDFREDNNMFLDIGERSEKLFENLIKKSKTIIWNGPMGYFEKEEFAKGTYAVAKAIIESDAYSIVGGGETTSAISKIKVLDKFDFVSTGGGAMLEFLAGNKLPGIEALS